MHRSLDKKCKLRLELTINNHYKVSPILYKQSSFKSKSKAPLCWTLTFIGRWASIATFRLQRTLLALTELDFILLTIDRCRHHWGGGKEITINILLVKLTKPKSVLI